jgi:hypothetical protein
MSEKRRPLSRRALLRSAGLTPIAVLALSSTKEVEAAIGTTVASLGLGNDDGVKFGEIVKHLWAALQYGSLGTEIGDDVLAAALNKSAQHIVSNLALFPSDGKDVETIGCAYLCGLKAATKAGTGTIDAAIFNEAWDETKTETQAKLARARAISGNDAPGRGGMGC